MQKATRGVGSEKDPVPFPVAAEFMRRGLKTQRQILPFHGLKVREPSWFEIGWNALTKFSRFAEGGLISGEPIPGLPGTDNIPGLLTKGEFVIPKPQVDRLGVPFLEGLRKFATGGLVSSGGVQAPVPSTGSGPGFSQEVIQAFSRASLGLQNAFTLFSNTTDALKMAMTTFNAAASELAKALASFTGKLEVTGQHGVGETATDPSGPGQTDGDRTGPATDETIHAGRSVGAGLITVFLAIWCLSSAGRLLQVLAYRMLSLV
jgi:hypothetical protein